MTRPALAIAIAASLLTMAVGGAPLQSIDLAAEERAIRARGAEMLALENAREMSKAVKFYADSAVLQGPGGPMIEGLATIRAIYERTPPPGMPVREGKVLSKVVKVAASGDLAWEYGTAQTTIKLPAGDVVELGKHLIIWKKVNGEWYITGMSWSNDKPPGR